MHFLITAGPTREYLDSVRFLTNASTGKTGYACAQAARKRGHRVTLVTGPVTLAGPKGVQVVKCVSAAQMAQAVKIHFTRCDCVIMTAAVCDYRPQHIAPHKTAKTRGKLSLELERTEDILAALGAAKQQQLLIGFALQDRAPRRTARRKMAAKDLDVIVLNTPAALGADRSDIEILTRGGAWQTFPALAKTALADKLIRLAERLTTAR